MLLSLPSWGPFQSAIDEEQSSKGVDGTEQDAVM